MAYCAVLRLRFSAVITDHTQHLVESGAMKPRDKKLLKKSFSAEYCKGIAPGQVSCRYMMCTHFSSTFYHLTMLHA